MYSSEVLLRKPLDGRGCFRLADDGSHRPAGYYPAVGAPGGRGAESKPPSGWRRVVLEVHAALPGLSGL